MRVPVFPVLGAFLFIAIFSPFVLMLAGVALTGDPDAARVGLYLLLNVTPVAIPSVLFMLAVAWAFRLWETPPVASASGVASMPPVPDPSFRPAAASVARRTTDARDVVIDVVAVEAPARAPRPLPLPAPAARYALTCRRPESQMRIGMTAR
jgi:hypothetical protein